MENGYNKAKFSSIEEELVAILIEKKYTITTAESCTGGMISSAIVNVAGASRVLNEAYVTYANEAKMRILGVKKETIDKYGVVSEETVKEMAEGVARAAKADCAIAVSGIAGPDGGTQEKPVGTVFAAFYVLGQVKVVKYNLSGDRYSVRKQTTNAVIHEMVNLLR